MSYGYYPPYVTVAEKKAKAETKLKALQKKNPGIRPVLLASQALARTWWGKAWNKNLERYADYHNRIGRGRSYVRHGAVLDLQIVPGEVRALVQGSTAKPYQVVVSIKAIAKRRWAEIKKECQGKLDSLPELLAGKFPAALQEVFMREGEGLFPTPKEIKFDCSCPDWASMCKHVAAVLYGVGARLDEDPSLFFTLRNVEVNELVSAAVRATTARILTKAAPSSAKVIADADLAGIFGISMEEPDFAGLSSRPVPPFAMPEVESQAPPKSSKAAKAQDAKSAVKIPRKRSVRGLPEALRKLIKKKLEAKKKVNTPISVDMATQILTIISNRKKGISVDDLCSASGCPKQKLYGIVHRLKAQGKVKSMGHGIYGKG